MKQGDAYGKYIRFESGMLPGSWFIRSKCDETMLGTVERCPKWKKPVFCPFENTQWDVDCLKAVAQFLEDAR